MKLEKYYEQKYKVHIQKLGGLCLKFVSPGWSGAPDRIILLPNGVFYLAEFKMPGKNLRPLQLKRKAELEALGIEVKVIDYEVKELQKRAKKKVMPL